MHRILASAIWAFVFVTTASLGTADDAAHSHAPAYRGADEPSTPTEIYGQGVRETDWRSPSREARGFHLPSGFGINLFAAEPMIAKPLNMAWDHRGRLWVTSTVEYPYPAADLAKARDKILILEDTNLDGQADKVTTFAEGLNIPMGILPMHDGAIAFNIPNIVYLRDTNGDDHLDEQEVLLGPFDTSRDTHGMINSLRLGGDGWIYACHGFNNQSRVTDRAGNTIEMHSGNTFRFTPDGRHAQVYSHGQVNPFGLTSDEWGNWYSADCHSKPITALLRGGYYPSFGRPHDGLGFAPSMMDHLHGSTAISGLCYYQADHFPPAYQRLFYSGNVMTSRINCNALRRSGATAAAAQKPDFLTSDDPWFRPVDIQLGPDGGLYIADFYNKIIGHYEVPLTHAGRDRTSGRIWRIAYTPNAPDASAAFPRAAVSESQLIGQLSSPNVTLRQLTTIQLARRCDAAGTAAGQAPDLQLVNRIADLASDPSAQAEARVACVEVLALAEMLSPTLAARLIDDADPRVAGRALRIFANLPSSATPSSATPSSATPGSATPGSPASGTGQWQWPTGVVTRVTKLLEHSEPQVILAAVEFLASHGNQRAADAPAVVLRLLGVVASSSDPTLVHAARIGVRDLLRDENLLQQIHAKLFSPRNQDSWQGIRNAYLGILPALNSEFAAANLLDYAATLGGDLDGNDQEILRSSLKLANQFPASVNPDAWTQVVRNLSAGDHRVAIECLRELASSLTVSGKKWDDGQTMLFANFRDLQLAAAANALMQDLSATGSTVAWRALGDSTRPLTVQERKRTDGSSVQLWSSFPLGEQHVGTWQSEAFTCPDVLTFWLAGHNGAPSELVSEKSFVRLLDSSGNEIARALPPRNDAAHRIQWDLTKHSSALVRFEIIDGDNGGAYAWLAVGGFSEASLNPGQQHRLLDDIQRLVELPLGQRVSPAILGVLRQSVASKLSPIRKSALACSLLIHDSQPLAARLVQFAASVNQPSLVPDGWLTWDDVNAEDVILLAEGLAKASDALSQRQLSSELLKSADGCRLLASLLQRGIMGAVALGPKPEILPNGLSKQEKQALQAAFSAVEGAEEIRAAVENRFNGLDWSQPDVRSGQSVFESRCASCHQLGGQGAVVGPQLDGAIKRTRRRLAEDILAPNLNVDLAFRTTSFLLDDDAVVSGLVTSETAAAVSLVKPDGKPEIVPTERIVERKQSDLSLMPSGLAEQLTDSELANLLHFLTTFAP